MTFALVPLLAAGMQVGAPTAPAALAGALADADSVDWVRADRAHHTITFAIDRAGEAYRLVATVDGGTVTALAIRDAGRGRIHSFGALTWLSDEMADVDAVAHVDVDDRGHVTLVTTDDRRIAVEPGRGDGNDGPRARWAAAWS